jgi:hypothetical protein
MRRQDKAFIHENERIDSHMLITNGDKRKTSRQALLEIGQYRARHATQLAGLSSPDRNFAHARQSTASGPGSNPNM